MVLSNYINVTGSCIFKECAFIIQLVHLGVNASTDQPLHPRFWRLRSEGTVAETQKTERGGQQTRDYQLRRKELVPMA